MRASGTFSPANLADTATALGRALQDAGLPPTAAQRWLASAAGRLDRDGQWSLEYDHELELASFEVWKDDRLVFGLDDWLPLRGH